VGRVAEAGPVSLARVRDQRELTDDQSRAARVEQRAIELALLVGEDAQVRDLLGEPIGGLRAVALCDADEDAEPRADRPARSRRGSADALDDGSQRSA
jgi:hypothetical protein